MTPRISTPVQLAAIAIGLVLGALIASRIGIAHAQPDPIVASDHATGTPAIILSPSAPPIRFAPTRYAQFKARMETAGKWTGGGWLAAGICLVLRAARKRWPSLRRGWRDHVTGGVMGAAAWVVLTVPMGATAEVTLWGMLLAAVAGRLIGMDPGEKQPAAGRDGAA